MSTYLETRTRYSKLDKEWFVANRIFLQCVLLLAHIVATFAQLRKDKASYLQAFIPNHTL